MRHLLVAIVIMLVHACTVPPSQQRPEPTPAAVLPEVIIEAPKVAPTPRKGPVTECKEIVHPEDPRLEVVEKTDCILERIGK